MSSLYLASKQSKIMWDEDLRLQKRVFDRTVKNVNFYDRDTSAETNPIGFTNNVKDSGIATGYDANELAGNTQSLEKTIGELNGLINGQVENLKKNPHNLNVLDESKNYAEIIAKMDFMPELNKYNQLVDYINNVPIDIAKNIVDDLMPSLNEIINLLHHKFKEFVFTSNKSLLAVGALNRTETATTTMQNPNDFMQHPTNSLDANGLTKSYYDFLKYYKTGTKKKEADPHFIKKEYLPLDARIRETFKTQHASGVTEAQYDSMYNDFWNRVGMMSNFIHKVLKMSSIYHIIENQIFDDKFVKINNRMLENIMTTQIYNTYNNVVRTEMTSLGTRVTLKYPNLTLKSFMYKNEINTQVKRKEEYEASKPAPMSVPTVEWTQPTGSGKPKTIRKATKKDDKDEKYVKLDKSFNNFDQAGNTPFAEPK